MERADLLNLSKAQLDALFRASPAGPIPAGEGRGTAIVWHGSWLRRPVAWAVRAFAWQGKVFRRAGDGASAALRNRVSPIGVEAIAASVYTGASWIDRRPCVVLDYSRTSLVAAAVRDEIRQVAPGLYLGKVFLGRRRVLDFSLDFNAPSAGAGPRTVLRAALLLLLVFGWFAYLRFTTDRAVTYASDVDHFKYGSTGGERESGLPYAIWQVLPEIFPDHLPTRRPPDNAAQGYVPFGFTYEGDRDLPVGVSRRNVRGVDLVFLNCAACHAGTVRTSPAAEPILYVRMPGNTIDLQGFERFLFDCAADERFNADRILAQIDRRGGLGLDEINRLLIRYYAIPLMREKVLMLRQRFRSFMDFEPPCGPGRVDTFNPAKALLNFPMDRLDPCERVGNCDLPSIWLQGQREGRQMNLHWDGNNASVRERNRSAAFGTGAFPPSLDRRSIRRLEAWLLEDAGDGLPPAFPYRVDAKRAGAGRPLYERYCAECHGRDGRDFAGQWVGKVEPIERVGTDPHRLDNYTPELAAAQNSLYAGYDDERFRHFKKTFGYANQPLDGIWLRAPYLHNGSVPTLRDLLEKPEDRPKRFFRGYNVYDPERVGFVSTVASENGRPFFEFDTALPGNGNQGHEYGTGLSPAEKDALVEYLKNF